MKRLKIVALMLMLFFLVIGCEKDEVVAPEGKDDVQQPVEVVAEDEATEVEAAETVDPAKEAESTEASNEEGQVAPPSEQVNTKKEPSSQPENNKNNQSTQQVTTKTAQNTKNDKPKESVEKPKETTSTSTTEKTSSEKPKEEVKEEAPPAPAKPSTAPEPTKPKEMVTITIVAPGIKDTILPSTSVEFKEGDTVLSVTQRIVRARGIQISVTGANATAYVQGIDNLYEFDHGPLSGWEAFVNGQGLDRSAGVYSVQPGQAIMWRYTQNYME
jgi:hypothetical protein